MSTRGPAISLRAAMRYARLRRPACCCGTLRHVCSPSSSPSQTCFLSVQLPLIAHFNCPHLMSRISAHISLPSPLPDSLGKHYSHRLAGGAA